MFSSYMENISLKVANGNSIRFWKDLWVGNTSLESLFPTLFNIICDKEEMPSEVLARKAVLLQWNFKFRRNMFDWEKETLTELYTLLDESGVANSDGNGQDRLIWQGCDSGKFTGKDFRIGVITDVEQAMCKLCSSDLESLDHTFIHACMLGTPGQTPYRGGVGNG
ncbi:hypothetical protein RHSIM_Rhsim11G0018500 [Rhododendron simsii]|uniref:Reverse transcriptase zinc-binding domain-containing protein n=1 Tax=Rhododendron simsii TaxID=118357 RepID=A0A834G5D8_RHOSS|nr:hypothetical protein RHSIM_Rhsim11G0018500 [Rhododendron simsii]